MSFMNRWRDRLPIVAVLGAAMACAPPASPANSTQDHWVATWGASPSPPNPDSEQMRQRKLEFTDQTVWEIVHITLGGDRVRVRLSNAFGSARVTIGAAHIALRSKGAEIVAGSDRVLTFSGRPAVAIPQGAVVLSDAVELKAPASADLAISLYLPGGPTVAAGLHYAAAQISYVAAGNRTGEGDLPENMTITSWAFLTGVDVTGGAKSATVVTLGDSITDGSRSTPDTNRRWPNILANRLLEQRKYQLAVVDAGIGGNRILHDGAGPSGPQYGPSALSRFERDVLAPPGVKYVIVLEGVNDIGHPGGAAPMSEDVTAEDIIAGLRQLIERAHERGLKIFGGTITPLGIAPSPKDAKRQAVNEWIRTGKAFDGVIDFDKAVRDPEQPVRLAAAYDSGDHLHPSDAGYKAMGEAVDLTLFAQ